MYVFSHRLWTRKIKYPNSSWLTRRAFLQCRLIPSLSQPLTLHSVLSSFISNPLSRVWTTCVFSDLLNNAFVLMTFGSLSTTVSLIKNIYTCSFSFKGDEQGSWGSNAPLFQFFRILSIQTGKWKRIKKNAERVLQRDKFWTNKLIIVYTGLETHLIFCFPTLHMSIVCRLYVAIE